MVDKRINVLFVDDEESNLFSFKANFRLKYNVFTAISGEAALQLLEKQSIDIIITDQRMPGMTGVELLELVVEKYPESVRILLTGFADMNAVIEAVNKGKIYQYLTKPWNEEELDKTIQGAYQQYITQREMKIANEKLAINNDQLEFMLRQKLLS